MQGELDLRLCSSVLEEACRDTSDDEKLFAVAPWQGIPQLLLKSLNLAGNADTLFRKCSAKHLGVSSLLPLC